MNCEQNSTVTVAYKPQNLMVAQIDQSSSALLEQLPDNVLLQIFAHIEIQDIALCQLISKHIRSVLSQPNFAWERIRQGTAQELLCVVGGKTPAPIKKSSKYGKKSNHKGCTMEPNSYGILAYVPSLRRWSKFGNDHNYLGRIADYRVVQICCHTLVFLGGVDLLTEEVTDEVWCYCFTSNKWDRLPNMSRKRSAPSFEAIAVKNDIYVFGSDVDDNDNDCYCEKYSMTERGCWVDSNSMPFSIEMSGICLYKERYVYIIGTQCEQEQYLSGTTTFFIYDTLTDSWRVLNDTNPNIIRGRSPCVSFHENKIMIMGGYYDDSDHVRYISERIEHGEHLNFIHIYDINCQLQSEVLRLPKSLRGASTCHFNGCLTVVGGCSSFMRTNASTSVWSFSKDDTIWRWIHRSDLQLLHPIVYGYTFTIRI